MTRIDQKLPNKKLSRFFFALAVLIGLGVIGAYFIYQDQLINWSDFDFTNLSIRQSEPVIKTNLVARQIDGALVEPGRDNIFPVAVMIENHPLARPQSGLANANLVYEALAEGGITRFMAIFADGQELAEIGPVRSARPYFLDWVSEFGALFFHHGASFEGWDNIEKFNIFDIDQWWSPQYFWKTKNREVPHNVYTSTELINKALKDKDAPDVSIFSSWIYKDETPLADRPAETADLTINYSTNSYRVDWRYDREYNDYIRYEAGQLHLDKDGQLIRAKNVIVQTAAAEVVSAAGHLLMGTVGTDKTLILQDGFVIPGYWLKKSRVERTRYYNDVKNEIWFNRGTTWIEMVTPDTEVTY